MSFVSAALSGLLVDDTVCLFLAPLVVRLCREHRLPLGPFLLAVATSANIGSAGTLVGNPQNMLIGSLSGLSFARFAVLALPVVIVGWSVNAALLWVYFGRRLPRDPLPLGEQPAPSEEGPPSWLCTLLLLGLAGGFLAGVHLGYAALAGALVFVVADRTEPTKAFARVDWQLLVFFCGLFVVVAALQTTGVVGQAWEALAPRMKLDQSVGLAGLWR